MGGWGAVLGDLGRVGGGLAAAVNWKGGEGGGLTTSSHPGPSPDSGWCNRYGLMANQFQVKGSIASTKSQNHIVSLPVGGEGTEHLVVCEPASPW